MPAQGCPRLHVRAYIIEQFGHARVGIATAHDVKRLEQWHASLHHGGELTGKDSDIFGLDGLTRAHAALFNLGRKYALAPQGSFDLVFTRSANFALDLFATPVLALPFEYELLDTFRCSCHGAFSFYRCGCEDSK